MCKPMWRVVKILISSLPFAAAGGCFWASQAPNFCKDPVVEVAVIWERILPVSNCVEITSWCTTNQAQVLAISRTLNNIAKWESLSTMITYHPTRIIITTKGALQWEIHMFGLECTDKLAMFNRGDIGVSGVIGESSALVNPIQDMISAEKGFPVDLRADYRHQCKWASLPRHASETTKRLLERFP